MDICFFQSNDILVFTAFKQNFLTAEPNTLQLVFISGMCVFGFMKTTALFLLQIVWKRLWKLPYFLHKDSFLCYLMLRHLSEFSLDFFLFGLWIVGLHSSFIPVPDCLLFLLLLYQLLTYMFWLCHFTCGYVKSTTTLQEYHFHISVSLFGLFPHHTLFYTPLQFSKSQTRD